MEGVPVHCQEHAICICVRLFAFASSFLVASSRMARSWQYLCACGVAPSHPAVLSVRPFRPHASSPPVLRSRRHQSISFWASRGRGARLHYGGNSPPVWRECPSTAKSMLSAFACGCLFPLASSSMASHPFACNCAPGLCQIIYIYIYYGQRSLPCWRGSPPAMERIPVATPKAEARDLMQIWDEGRRHKFWDCLPTGCKRRGKGEATAHKCR